MDPPTLVEGRFGGADALEHPDGPAGLQQLGDDTPQFFSNVLCLTSRYLRIIYASNDDPTHSMLNVGFSDAHALDPTL